ncbi:MAG: NUDIX domain-containing protein [Mariprofundaceae bacterium]|nr:NUDIX domain-containing protein [Mariprofundaceae bacterium]
MVIDVQQQVDIALIALLNAQHEVLLLQRPAHVHCPDVWSFPGGKVEQHESPKQAAIRELKEETHLSSTLTLLGNSSFNYPDKSILFHFFSAVYAKEPIQAESPHQWCKLQQLHHLDMPAANQQLIRMLLDNQSTA